MTKDGEREHTEILKETHERVKRSEYETMKRLFDDAKWEKFGRDADVPPRNRFTSKSERELEDSEGEDAENGSSIPIWTRVGKKGGGFKPVPISDDEVKKMFRETLIKNEIEAMAEEKKLEELKKQRRQNPTAQTGPIKATPVTNKPVESKYF